jgi:hypothetical protein
MYIPHDFEGKTSVDACSFLSYLVSYQYFIVLSTLGIVLCAAATCLGETLQCFCIIAAPRKAIRLTIFSLHHLRTCSSFSSPHSGDVFVLSDPLQTVATSALTVTAVAALSVRSVAEALVVTVGDGMLIPRIDL